VNEPENVNRKEAARFLNLSVQTLALDAVDHHLRIPFCKCGARCIYRLADLRRWLDARAVNAPAA
jgi:hypothetical protein